MKRKKKFFKAYAIVDATIDLGVFEAKNEEEATELAEKSEKYEDPVLCYKCSEQLDVGSINDVVVYEISEEDYLKRKEFDREREEGILP